MWFDLWSRVQSYQAWDIRDPYSLPRGMYVLHSRFETLDGGYRMVLGNTFLDIGTEQPHTLKQQEQVPRSDVLDSLDTSVSECHDSHAFSGSGVWSFVILLSNLFYNALECNYSNTMNTLKLK